MPGFSTEQAPKYFSGEDVIGEELYGNRSQNTNPIPPQLAEKLKHFPIQQPIEYQEEINTPSQISVPTSPFVVNIKKPQIESETITKNIKINLEINLKINVI